MTKKDYTPFMIAELTRLKKEVRKLWKECLAGTAPHFGVYFGDSDIWAVLAARSKFVPKFPKTVAAGNALANIFTTPGEPDLVAESMIDADCCEVRRLVFPLLDLEDKIDGGLELLKSGYIKVYKGKAPKGYKKL